MNARDFVAYARIPIVAGAVLLMAVAVVYAELPVLSIPSFLVIACGTLLITALYSFNSWTDFHEDKVNTPGLAHIGRRSRGSILVLSLVSGTLSLLFSALIGLQAFILIAATIVTGFLYSYPLLRRFGIPRYKEIFAFKNVIIAVWWSQLPMIAFFAAGRPLDAVTMFVMFFLFLQFFIESVMRDLPDRHGDASAGFATIPSRLGLKTTLAVLLVLNTVSMALIAMSTLYALYAILMLMGCAWRYFVILLLYEDRPLRFTFDKVNYPNYVVLLVGALFGKLLF